MTLKLTHKKNIATVELNRPEASNAFDSEVIAQLIKVLDALSTDDSCRVLVLGATGKHFSAGADLHWMKGMAALTYEENLEDAGQLACLMHTLYHFPKPVIARVQGAAYGGAVGLVCCADIAVAAENARFCLSEVKLGLSPAVISPYVINVMGPRRASYYFMTADVMNAGQAKSCQLVQEIYPSDSLNADTFDLACRIAEHGPEAVKASKTLIHAAQAPLLNSDLQKFTIETIARLRVSPEGQEGMQAFFEKRKPSWQEHTS